MAASSAVGSRNLQNSTISAITIQSTSHNFMGGHATSAAARMDEWMKK